MTQRRTSCVVKDTATLHEYEENMKRIRMWGGQSHLSETEINAVMHECLQSAITKQKVVHRKESITLLKKLKMFLKKFFICSTFFIVTVSILYMVLQHKPIQYYIQSKLQDYIYPGMKILRKLFLPIISLYPSLTNFYDESCLVVNPFFRVPDMSCPCEDVRAVMNLTGENTQQDQYHSGIPIIVKVIREEVPWDKLKTLYHNHSSIFDRDASHLIISSPTNENIKGSPGSLFTSNWDIHDNTWDHTHVQWRCNRMEPARLLRSIFGTPVGEPNYAAGVTIEKLVLMDGPRAPAYQLPTTDGTTVFIHQASGSRMIMLSPANECKDACTTVSIELPPNHILWFSWWYWRATSMPSPASTSVSITYVGSYL